MEIIAWFFLAIGALSAIMLVCIFVAGIAFHLVERIFGER